jgi:uncharacterized protein (TIGR00299 family) protein
MHTLAFDGRMGASGDMLLGALIAVGGDPSVLSTVEDAVDVRYDITDTTRCGISGTAVDVLIDDGTTERHHDHAEGHGDHVEGQGNHRTFPKVIEIVESMDLPASVESDAVATFELLGEAEASVHDTDLEETHFHEVGADDAIADVVGVSLLIADLDPDRIVTTPLATGGGQVEMSHGIYPVPPPAVIELAERADWSLRGGPIETELLTPTGAAILAHYADGVESLPSLDIQASGYGAGSKRFDSHPNVLRAVRGNSTGDLERDSVTVLETHLDDATPETLGSLHETLSAVGALDIVVVPTTMKKSRPGHLIKVVVAPENARQVAQELAEQTGTLGVREHGSGHRFVADREIRTVTLSVDGDQFEVDVKVASFDDGTVFDVSGEHDDARSVADETGYPTREILRRAEAVVRDQL